MSQVGSLQLSANLLDELFDLLVGLATLIKIMLVHHANAALSYA
jgi:hypothetical protein